MADEPAAPVGQEPECPSPVVEGAAGAASPQGTTPLLPPESRPGLRGGEEGSGKPVDWFCTGRLRAASEDHRTSWKIFMAECPKKLESVQGLMDEVRPLNSAASLLAKLAAALGRPPVSVPPLRSHQLAPRTDRAFSSSTAVASREGAGAYPA